MSKVRIYTLAKELGIDNQKMLEVLDLLEVPYKSVSSTIDEETVGLIKDVLTEGNTPKTNTETSSKKTEPKAEPKEATKESNKVSPKEPKPKAEGKTATKEKQPKPAQTVTSSGLTHEEEAELAAMEAEEEAQKLAAAEAQAARERIPHRAPVVTIMGHVDHGKTSLLDYIRNTRVAAKEAGGITQHVGAFEAQTSRGKIIFIDTPGHEAFTTIRARGAHVADIAIIVIAADDSLMPQTREAIAHAKAAKVPIIVAINKIDLPQADPERVKADLTQVDLVPEEYGGDTVVIPVSARTGKGVEDLLEYIIMTAELEDLRADPEGDFAGVIIEGKVDKQAGVLATVMIQEGTLNVGDFLVVGESYGKIKAMTDSAGKRIKEAGPSTPVQILGFSEVPVSGEKVQSASNEHAARDVILARAEQRRAEEEARERRKGSRSLEDILGTISDIRTVNLVLRADTQGSVEAIQGILARRESDDVKVNVMLSGIGAPTEGDVLLASTADATILCFSVSASNAVTKVAESKGVSVKSFPIIYEMIDEVERLIKGNLEPVFEEQYLGRAEVRMVIRHPKNGNIAGSYVLDGSLKRNAKCVVKRGKQVVHEGTIVGLKRFKDDVREVQQGYECGINLDWNDIMEGDIIEASELVEVEQD